MGAIACNRRGIHRMTVHTCRVKRQAKGARAGKMARVMVSLQPDDMRRLTWWANKHGVPVSNVLRNAVWAYLLPIAADADAAQEQACSARVAE